MKIQKHTCKSGDKRVELAVFLIKATNGADRPLQADSFNPPSIV